MLADEGDVDEWGAPRRIRALPVSDLMAGLSATIGVASALYHRALTGEGQLIDASLLRGAMAGIGRAVLQEPVSDAVITEPALKRVRDALEAGASYAEAIEGYGQGGLAPTAVVRRIYHTAYETSDGAVVVGALTRANREAIREAIGFEYEGGDDPDFDPLDDATRERMTEVKRRVAEIMRTRTTAEWIEALRRTGAPRRATALPGATRRRSADGVLVHRGRRSAERAAAPARRLDRDVEDAGARAGSRAPAGRAQRRAAARVRLRRRGDHGAAR